MKINIGTRGVSGRFKFQIVSPGALLQVRYGKIYPLSSAPALNRFILPLIMDRKKIHL